MYKSMEKRPISELIETTMQKVKEMIDANTVVGEPVTTVDGATLIPVTKVSLGLAGGGGGGGGLGPAENSKDTGGGGGIGTGVKIEPVAFIVVMGDSVKLLHVSAPAESTIDRVIDMVPGVIDKITDFIEKDKNDDKNDPDEQ